MNAPRCISAANALTAALLLALLQTPPAQAQPSDHRLAFQGGVGWGQTWSDESRLGGGFSLEGSFEVRVLRKLGLQFGVSRYSHDRSFEFPSNVRFTGDSRMFSGDLLYHLEGSRVQPFLLGGVALIHTENTSRAPVFRFDGHPVVATQVGEEISEYSEDARGLSFGGGVEILLGPSLALRREVRVVFIRRTLGSVGISYRW